MDESRREEKETPVGTQRKTGLSLEGAIFLNDFF
jgi:hypothetical protein